MRIRSIVNEQLILVLEGHERGPSLLRELDLSKFFCQILQQANGFVPSEAGSIFLVDRSLGDTDDHPELVVVASYGLESDDILGARLGLDHGIAGYVCQQGQAYVSATPSSDLLLSDWLDEHRRPKAGTVVAVPLIVGDRVVGVLELLKERDGDAFDAHELELLELFATTISVGIANAVEAQRSRDMARRDDLTRLYNDRYLHHVLTSLLRKALAEDHDCALLFLDLDHFKKVNDTHGHLIGSRVLQETGDVLRRVLPGSAIPARYGGDEFVVILPEHGPQEATWVAESIRQTTEGHTYLEQPDPEDPEIYPGLSLRGMSFSIGVATLGEIEGRAKADVLAIKNTLLRRADERMYQAKESGRNRTEGAPEASAASAFVDDGGRGADGGQQGVS